MIDVIDRRRRRRVRAAEFRRLLEALGRRHRVGAATDLSIVFVGDRAMRTLNRTYRKMDRPTDVLSFPMGERSPDGRRNLGDIVIDVPYAERQARREGRTLDRELRALAIHGYHHLLGFDHGAGIEEEDERARAALGAD